MFEAVSPRSRCSRATTAPLVLILAALLFSMYPSASAPMNCFEDCSGSAGLTAFLSVSCMLAPVTMFFSVPVMLSLTPSSFWTKPIAFVAETLPSASLSEGMHTEIVSA
ncbi:MAG: hypothetical protein BWY81_00858 [Firmicutes bacterium ADurb.Bin467]|nr:MAG: hypothetical protein BWY81_00858 [Firmicutes bacterium ADurb.Bin467]